MENFGQTRPRSLSFGGRTLLLWAVLFFAALFCAGCGGVREEGFKGSLCVASWNMQTFYDGETCGKEFDEFQTGWTQRDYEARLETASRIIRRLVPEPDILVMQEVENGTVARDLCRLCSPAGYLYHGVAAGWDSGIQCAFISKIPIQPDDVVTIGVGGLGQRDVLQIHLDTPKGDAVVWVVHARSRRRGGQESEWARLELARAVKDAAAEARRRWPGAVRMIAGDFNADLEASEAIEGPASLFPAYGLEAQGYERLGSILVTGERDIATWPEGAWHSFWYDGEVPKDREGSYYYAREGKWERFDQILCSEEAFDGARLDFAGGGVYHRWDLCSADGTPDSYDLRRREGVSDHLPVWVVLKGGR